MRALILSCNTGEGHNSCAAALQEYFTAQGTPCQIADALGLPLVFADERLSSREAKRILRENGLSGRKMRGKVDMVAASLILQAWLDARHHSDA